MKLSNTKISSPLRGERAATMLEFALILPIFCLLVFGFIDIGRYWQARAALQQAGWEGMNEFSIDRDIKKKGSLAQGDPEAFQEAHDRIKQKMLDRAKALSIGSSIQDVTVEPSFPATSSKFLDEPVTINVKARFVGLFLPIDVQVAAKVSGFVENFRTTSQPLVTDCNGNVFDATSPPGQYPYGSYCPCEKGEHSYRVSATTCGCSSLSLGSRGLSDQVMPDGSTACGCPSGQVPIAPYDWSVMYSYATSAYIQGMNNSFKICCPSGTLSQCPGQSSHAAGYGYSSCDCTCGSGATPDSAGNCVCSNSLHEYVPSTYPYIPGSCSCQNRNEACPSGSYRDSSTCECKCNTSSTGKPKMIVDGICQCVADATSCTVSGQTFDPVTCECKCPSTSTPQNGSCACAANQGFNGSNVCTCQLSASSCQPPNVADPHMMLSGCACVCAGGSSPNGSGVCACPANKEWGAGAQSNTCVCTNPPTCNAANGEILKSDCTCGCPDGSTPSVGGKCCPTGTSNVGGICCPTGATNEGGACKCPTGKTLSGDGKSCICDTAGGYTNTAGVCCQGCPRGFAPNNSAGTCGCESCVSPKVVVNANNSSYCSQAWCRDGCSFNEVNGSCSSCPPG